MKDSRLITYTVDKLLKDSYFRRGVCQISSICGSVGASWGGITGNITDQADLVTYVSDQLGTVDLQSVTDAGNDTSNAIQITGLGGYNPALESMILASTGGSSFIVNNRTTFGSQITLANDGGINLATGNGSDGSSQNVIQVFPIENSGSLGVQINGRVVATEAINAAELATLGQVEDLLSTGGMGNIIQSTQPASPLLPNNYYTNGFDVGDPNWVLPPVAGNTGKRIGIINVPEVTINLASNTGGNDIFTGGALTSSTTVGPGEITILHNNSIYWVVIV